MAQNNTIFNENSTVCNLSPNVSDIATAIAPALRSMLANSNGVMGTVEFLAENTPGQINIKSDKKDTEIICRKLEKEIRLYYQKQGTFPQTVAVENVGLFKATLPKHSQKRMNGKIILITGAAQGFGKEIADLMVIEGANVVYADINGEGAQEASKAINSLFGEKASVSICADVGDEEQIKNMVSTAVLTYGGIDVFISNAGIVRAGSLDEMTKETFENSTKINYTSYFLGAKYVQKVMKIQHRYNSKAFFDIIQINSKSGLEGSNKNFAYAGSKFGGIGLTQSFALELCPFNIKVNAVCPGNFLDGPLWSDPENGLLVQYLKAGKVQGAKTVEDVKKAYEAKVPMNRGCRAIDVARAIYYCIEQNYETGQAIPVTGGQVTLA